MWSAHTLGRAVTGENGPVLRSVPRRGPSRFSDPLPDLPAEIVGRHSEFDRVLELLAAPGIRLVTLIGFGGVGKTTLATAVARRLWSDYDGSVLFGPIAAATTPDEVYTALAQAAGWDATDPDTTAQVVRDGLGEVPTLLVLDNCEQVDRLAPVVDDLLSACAGLVIVATSRRPVGVSVERLVPIEPLEVPSDVAGVREVASNEAATVLVNAARRRNPSFAVTRDNAEAVAELCRRLDGLPLALELAAARLHLLPPQQLLDLLAHRFEVLKVDTTERADRHRRLWATIDWSYQLLEPIDQARLRSLGVFADGFTLDAAAAVAGCSTVSMLDTIDRLVAESLVRPVAARAGVGRFNLLESIREFALTELERLDELDPSHETHAEWVRELVERWGPGLVEGAEQAEAVAALDAERANIAAALQRSLDAGATERVLAIGVALWRYWWYRGLSRAGRAWLEDALAADPEPTAATAAAYVVASDLAEVTGDLPRARELIAPALEIYEQLGLDEELAPAWNGLGFVERELGNLDRARELHEMALATSERLGRLRTQASSLNGLGAVAERAGDRPAAIAHYRAALELVNALGDRYAAALVAQNLAASLLANGDRETAITTLRGALAESLELGDVQNVLVTLLNLADCEIVAGLLDEAEQHLDEGARHADAAGIAHYPAVIAHHRGRIADARGNVGAALAHYVDGLRIAVRVFRPIETIEFLERIGGLATEFGDDAVAATAFGTARAGRAATGTPPIADVAEWERTLTERGVVIDTTPGEWPDPAAAVLGTLVTYAATQAGERRTPAPDAGGGVGGGATVSAAPADPLVAHGLTPREAEVARLVVARRTDQEIADELFLALRTVTTHVSAVLRKLGVPSRRDVAPRLAELGIDV